jgi:hypothetical protein
MDLRLPDLISATASEMELRRSSHVAVGVGSEGFGKISYICPPFHCIPIFLGVLAISCQM